MSPEAQKLAQALLDHHKKVPRPQRESSPGIESCLIVYGDLSKRAGLSHPEPNLGKLLREVAQWCHANSWPPLNALVVNHKSRRPGRGYDRAPGCSREHWQDDVTACLNFAGYPDCIS
jgi:hypothetical protein